MTELLKLDSIGTTRWTEDVHIGELSDKGFFLMGCKPISRHAIDVAWNRGQMENINMLFGSKLYVRHDKPTNGEFIAMIADRLAIEMSA